MYYILYRSIILKLVCTCTELLRTHFEYLKFNQDVTKMKIISALKMYYSNLFQCLYNYKLADDVALCIKMTLLNSMYTICMGLYLTKRFVSMC